MKPAAVPLRGDEGDGRAADAAGLIALALSVQMFLFPYWKGLPLSGDEIFYWDNACALAKGHLIRNFLHPPLWSCVLSISAAISSDPVYGRAATVVIGSISAGILYLLGRSLFGRKAGMIAGIIYCVYPNIVGFSHYLWPEPLLVFLVLVAALVFFRFLGNERNASCVYLSSLVLGIGMLVKEFALIPFAAMMVSLAAMGAKDKFKLLFRGIAIFLAPVIIYSMAASALASRPVVLADAFVFNSNQADQGKAVWNHSTKENLKVFAGRVLEIDRMPGRLAGQILNLWTPTSFPIFRLLKSREGYDGVPHAGVIAYFAAGAYIVVIGLGLAGMCLAVRSVFWGYSVANMIFLTLTGSMFLMCSRFRISYMYIFLLYAAVVIADPGAALERLNWRRGIVMAIVLAGFAAIIVGKRSAFGSWG